MTVPETAPLLLPELTADIYAKKVRSIRERAATAYGALAEIEIWMKDDVPQILHEDKRSHALINSMNAVRDALAGSEGITAGPYTQEWVAKTVGILKEANAAKKIALGRYLEFTAAFEAMFPDSRPRPSPKKSDAIAAVYSLSLSSAHDMHDLQWLARLGAEVALDENSKEADRARRLRARRKRGFRMATIAIHNNDINRLIQIGFLDREDKEDMGAITDALQSFTMAAFSAVNAEDTRAVPRGAILQLTNRWRPMIQWMARLGEFIETTLNSEPKASKGEQENTTQGTAKNG